MVASALAPPPAAADGNPTLPRTRHYDPAALNRVIRASPGELDLQIPAAAVTGQIPRELVGGTLFGNGPGRLDIGGRLIHPFDGHGYIRALRFHEKGVRLQARFVRTPCFVAEDAAGKVRYRGLGTLVPGGPLRNILAPDFRNVANTCVLPWGGKLYALWEGGPPYRLDAATLDTQGVETFGGVLGPKTPFLAHTRLDAQRGRLVGLSPNLGRSRVGFTFYELDRAGTVVSRTESELDGMSFCHDFTITPDYYVVVENRVQPDLRAFVRYKLGQGTIIEVLRPAEGQRARILLVPRRPGRQPGQVIELADYLYSYHHANAWQQDGRIVLVGCAYEKIEFGKEFGYHGPQAALDPGVVDWNLPLSRFDIDPAAGTCRRSAIGSYSLDFPRVHPLRGGLPTRYVFGATNAVPGLGDPFDSLICADVHTGATAVYTPQPQCFVGEPIVVPRHGAAAASSDPADADGPVWVLVMFSDGQANRSVLAIFAGEHVADGPVATVALPVLLPYGLHGYWDGAAA